MYRLNSILYKKENRVNNQPRKIYLTGLKGLACLMIMTCHWLGIYKYAEFFPASMKVIENLENSTYKYLIDESYWLFLFFVVSGYLISQKKVRTFADLIKNIIIRFFRFAIPILFSYIVIYLIFKIVGFHNSNTVIIFESKWYQAFYQNMSFDIWNIILAPIEVLIYGNVSINNPYWVLRPMMLGSVVVYAVQFLTEYLKLDKHKFYLVILICFLSFPFSHVVFASVFGYLINMVDVNYEIVLKSKKLLIAVMLLSFVLCTGNLVLLKSVFFGLVLICVSRIKLLTKLFSIKIFTFLGDISWGIYSFHWPIMCSIGADVLISLANKNFVFVYWVAFLCVVFVTIIISYVFYITVEKCSNQVICLFK